MSRLQYPTELVSIPNFDKYTFPSENCIPGSAWHDWAKCGAIYALEQGKDRALAIAEQFAAQGTHKGSNTYASKLIAFKQGASRPYKLKKKDEDNE